MESSMILHQYYQINNLVAFKADLYPEDDLWFFYLDSLIILIIQSLI